MSDARVTVAVPAPLYKMLDYRSPSVGGLCPGVRVRVPLARRSVVGVVMAGPFTDAAPPEGLRPVAAVLDEAPVLPAELLQLLRWAAAYYQHPVGEVVMAALPAPLRAGADATWAPPMRWTLTEAGISARTTLPAHRRAQRAVLDAVAAGLAPAAGAARRRAADEGWIVETPSETPPTPTVLAPTLTADQQRAWDAFDAAAPGVTLLQGVTGSGKTEFYLRAAAEVLVQGAQVLVLVPEIGLTPQITARFRERFGETVAGFHSGMSDAQRTETWQRARSGHARVVVGTRSAVWLPFQRLGLLVVDEEHDVSFKQHEGFRYSARDVACYRGVQLGCPVLLGSATPALETLHNVRQGRYRRLELASRVHAAVPPPVELVDLRGLPLFEGLSPPLLKALDHCLEHDGQALLFLNRRGFAPVLLCHTCGWSAPCPQCDAHLTLHRGQARLHCHHCDYQMPVPRSCPSCGGASLMPVGQGTERIEAALAQRYPGRRVERLDSDRSRSARALATLLDDLHSGRVPLLVGTQMLAKGHDFPRLNLVGIVSADQALYGSDFRAIERMGALVTQVAGRAGRSGQPARVLLQTHEPDHPLLQTLVRRGYDGLAEAVLAEREAMALPPFSHMAVLRADAPDAADAMAFLQAAHGCLPTAPGVQAAPPMMATMERRAGRARALILLQGTHRSQLHRVLAPWVLTLDGLPAARRVRWSIDIDPYDTF